MKRSYYQATSECAKCAGYCCKGCPGSYLPEQFGATPSEVEEKVTELLKAGKLTIYDGVIMPSFTIPGSPKQDNWGDRVCNNLTSIGCKLQDKDKPHTCRTLEPRQTERGHCRQHNNHGDMINIWRDSGMMEKFYKVLESCVKER